MFVDSACQRSFCIIPLPQSKIAISFAGNRVSFANKPELMPSLLFNFKLTVLCTMLSLLAVAEAYLFFHAVFMIN